MCGIVGYTGYQNAENIVIDGLKALEYRGYDSAGIAMVNEKEIAVFKTVGRVAELEKILPTISTKTAIGHTRWATHGAPITDNAHPHLSFDGKIAVVHNGVISNYEALKKGLTDRGITFKSSTDSEIIAHMLALENTSDMRTAIENVGNKLEGATTFLAIRADDNAIYARRCGASLAIGIGENESLVASDATAISRFTKNLVFMRDGECAEITPSHVTFFKNGKKINKQIIKSKHIAPKECTCYMRAEIDEIPDALRRTQTQILHDLDENTLRRIKSAHKIYFCGCGTAFHACLYGKAIFERLLNVPCECVVASEFDSVRFVNKRDVGIFITQSGETADTLIALNLLKKSKAYSIAITNVPSSSITFEADKTLLLDAGAEIAVAATKSYNCQLLALYIIASICSLGYYDESKSSRLCDAIQALFDDALYEERIKKASLFFIGKGIDNVTAKEGALKFKEITYKSADAYYAGELKHGSIALIDDNSVAVFVATEQGDKHRIEATVSELRSRGAYVIAVSAIGDIGANKTLSLPLLQDNLLYPIISIVPLQSLALNASLCLGLNPDKPRNLAKSVTVV